MICMSKAGRQCWCLYLMVWDGARKIKLGPGSGVLDAVVSKEMVRIEALYLLRLVI